MSSFAERYAAGDRIAVWDELHTIESLADAGDAVRQDARDVARLTMERAAANLATIHGRLVGFGFHFDEPQQTLEPPSAEMAAIVRRLVAEVGPVPCSLQAWFEHVGFVWFRGHPASWSGSHPWHEELLDPIEFRYRSSWIDDFFELQAEYGEEGDDEFSLEFAGDFFHKNDVSGGAPTYASLPSDTADARVFEDNGAAYTDFVDSRPGDEDGIWFVDYLRRYFERGGFRRMRPDHTYPPAFWPGLAEGLLEI